MSENVKKFFEIVRGDQALKQQLAGAKDSDSLATIAVEVGKQKGFTFSIEDVKAALRQAIGGSRELSDNELDAVAGAGDLDFLGGHVD